MCVCVCLCAQNRGYQGLGASGAANSINSPTSGGSGGISIYIYKESIGEEGEKEPMRTSPWATNY